MSNPFTNVLIKPFEIKEIDSFGQLQFENLERISAGRGDNSMNFDIDGLWIGDQFFDSAPFKVDLDGRLVASSVVISGSITAGVGSDIDWSYIDNVIIDWAVIENVVIDWAMIETAIVNSLVVTNAMIESLNADKITTGTLTGRTIQTDAENHGRVRMTGGTDTIEWVGTTGASDYVNVTMGQTFGVTDFGFSAYMNDGYFEPGINFGYSDVGIYQFASSTLQVGSASFGLLWDSNIGGPHITTNAKLASHWTPAENDDYDLGNSTRRWRAIDTNYLRSWGDIRIDADLIVYGDSIFGGNLVMTSIPTSDPGFAGVFYRDGNDLKISTG